MKERNTNHATFSIERIYDAAPVRVFAAWASAEEKAKWNACHTEWVAFEQAMDFRVGGKEVNRVGPKGGTLHSFEAVYHDIVPNERIIYSYKMHLDDRLISVSLATVEFKPEKSKTRLVFTEQAIFVDGYEDSSGADREKGTGIGLDRLHDALKS